MIQEFIKNHFLSKLAKRPSLVIYDEARRYRDIALSLANDHVKVLDAGESAIIAREAASRIWMEELPVHPAKQLVIYLPFERPERDNDKIRDPFFIFSLGGSIFPSDASDGYKSLCQQSYPEHEEKIEQLFAGGEIPDFATVDAIKGGSSIPNLQSVTGEKSEKEIILALLFPNEEQQKQLVKNKSWLKEYKPFARSTIGLASEAKTLEAIQAELWRYLLFSEFVFDLPVELPPPLAQVPKAEARFQKTVMDICTRIRGRNYIEDTYIEKANHISAELKLEEYFKNEKDLGVIVTFSFEDNTYFNNFIEHLLQRDFGKADHFLKPNQSNQIWRNDATRSAYWQTGQYASDVLFQIHRLAQVWQKHAGSLDELFSFYAAELWKLDQAQRYFEGSAKEIISPNESLSQLIKEVRRSYFSFLETVQKAYQKQVEASGWAFKKTLRNVQVFDKKAAPLLTEGKKVAYFMVDALRFELAKELTRQIEKTFESEINPAAAYVPTVTMYAMAALLPKADKHLELRLNNGKLEPYIKDYCIKGPQDRLAYLQSIYGDRAHLVELDRLNENIPDHADLLVVATTEIDIAGESLPDNAALLMQETLKKIVRALHLLEQKGYHKAIMVADHGFMLKQDFQAGDALSKPIGEWVLQKSRCIGGKGNSTDFLMQLTPEDLGIRAEVEHFQFLRNYALFKSNTLYFHEGLSLQENVAPVVEVTLSKALPAQKVEIYLTYKGKDTGSITTLRPSVELNSINEGGTLFSERVIIKLEALDSKGNTIGTPVAGPNVNPSTNLIEFEPGTSFKVILEMKEEFEGRFKVVASDPVTNLVHASIELKTAYM